MRKGTDPAGSIDKKEKEWQPSERTRQAALAFQEENKKIACPICRHSVIVTSKGECPKCKTPLLETDDIPF